MRCTATNKSTGRQCKYEAGKGKRRCGVHANNKGKSSRKRVNLLPTAATRSVNVARRVPRVTGEKLPKAGYNFRKHQQKKMEIVNRMVKGDSARPRLPPGVLSIINRHLAIKPLHNFINELKTFKVEKTTDENNFKIQFPNALKHLFPTLPLQDLNRRSYKDFNAYEVGNLEIEYDMLISKLEVMGTNRNGYSGRSSGENLIKIINDSTPGFEENFRKNFREVLGKRISGISFQNDHTDVIVLIFVPRKYPSTIFIFVKSPPSDENEI